MNPGLGPLASGLLASALAVLSPAPPPGQPAASAAQVDAATLAGGADWFGEAVPVGPAKLAARSLADPTRILPEIEPAQQVRIDEQRVIIRITPAPLTHDTRPSQDARPSHDPRRMLFPEFSDGAGPRLVERKMAQCLPVGGIAGVQPDGASRLILYMRDQRIVSAVLEKGCNARDYYSGFLVERTSDGMVCASRDKLLSRTGANCTLGRLRQLIELDPDE